MYVISLLYFIMHVIGKIKGLKFVKINQLRLRLYIYFMFTLYLFTFCPAKNNFYTKSNKDSFF